MAAQSNEKTQNDKNTLEESSNHSESFEFFYGKASPFSQHHPAVFTVDGNVFNCAEQYMMYRKAVTFKDEEMRDAILSCSDPVQQKRYGRKVKLFDKDVWTRESEDVVRTATKAKFDQNYNLRKQLFGTYPKVLVEASPRDRIWGIGLGQSNPKAQDKSMWRGKNRLGYILTEVRDELMQEENDQKD